MPWRAASAAVTKVTVPSFGTSQIHNVFALAWVQSARGIAIATVANAVLALRFI
jgi:hypothetical protein